MSQVDNLYNRENLQQLRNQVFQNSLILHNLFLHLRSSVQDLKTVRTICKTWNSVASPILGKETAFQIHKYGKELLALENNASAVNDWLIRSVKWVQSEGPFSNYTEPNPTPIQSREDEEKEEEIFMTFLQKYSNIIENLELRVKPTFAEKVNNIFKSFSFTKLKTIKIYEVAVESFNETKQQDWMLQIKTKFSILPKLKELELCGDSSRMVRHRPEFLEIFPYRIICQGLLHAGKDSLTTIKIRDLFYPDLSELKKLSNIFWHGYGIMFFGPPTWNFDSLHNNMEDDKGMEPILKMFGRSQDWKSLHLPCFTNLTQLGLSFHVFGRIFAKLTPTQFPALKQVNIPLSVYCDFMVDPNLLKIPTWPQISHLRLETEKSYSGNQRDEISSVFTFMARIFPSVTNLVVFVRFNSFNKIPDEFFKDNFSQFGKWKEVKDLLVLIGENYDSKNKYCDHVNSTLAGIMDEITTNKNKFKDSKNLKLTLQAGHPSWVQDIGFGCQSFKKAFLSYPDLTLDGFKMRDLTMLNMKNFVERKKLKVKFRNIQSFEKRDEISQTTQ